MRNDDAIKYMVGYWKALSAAELRPGEACLVVFLVRLQP